jgi:molybdopterin converting factor small subunit
VGRALADLVRQYPGMEKELFDNKGQLHGHIEIYLNAESAFPGELEKPVQPGDDIQIVTFLAGG